MTSKPLVFHTSAYAHVADQMCRSHRLETGERQVKKFPDGERCQNITSHVRGEQAILVGGTHDDSSIVELYHLAFGLVKQGVQRLDIVVPYYGYSTQERPSKGRPGEVVSAKAQAVLLSSIPQAPGGNRIVLFDLHMEQESYYFEGALVPMHVQGMSFVRETALELAAGRPFVLASTDAGRLKWVQDLAEELKVDAAAVLKKRIDAKTIKLVAIAAQVEGQVVIIYDDMIRTGGSLMKAAEAYHAAGAAAVYAISTHGVLPGDSLAQLEASGLFQGIVCTDSHPQAQALKGTTKFLTVKECGQIFVKALVGLPPQFD